MPLESNTRVKSPINNRSPTDGEKAIPRPVPLKIAFPFASNETCAEPVKFRVTLFVGSDRFVKVP